MRFPFVVFGVLYLFYEYAIIADVYQRNPKQSISDFRLLVRAQRHNGGGEIPKLAFR